MKEVTSFKFELNKYIMPLGNSSVPNEEMSLHKMLFTHFHHHNVLYRQQPLKPSHQFKKCSIGIRIVEMEVIVKFLGFQIIFISSQ